MHIAPDWNERQARLREIIRKPEFYNEAQALFLSMHRAVHFSADGAAPTYMDTVWDGLAPADIAVMPTAKDVTIAWNIWHITRIEDLTVNILIDCANQLLNHSWLARLNTAVTDTGNAMTDDEIVDFSRNIDMEALKRYRLAVGENTQKVLQALSCDDMKRKVRPEGLEKIRGEGGVTAHPDSEWLLDFWGRKDVAGIILMPVTRHQIGHLNDSAALKNAIRRKNA
ncbi:DinB superfamily protein [Sporobacter termitidis DSM 10068]|uniref:DinB superfamily protein n=1 Tax=Sporobacter termitidis DSM 10068 TaxID=1123282 RepID=A0A1M5YXH4_9FIRM|nr:DinB family protein [Sporobacter termitidis]SHI16610.1 DinB superfamily protein [Sporobacter termitidis DSM 10068]